MALSTDDGYLRHAQYTFNEAIGEKQRDQRNNSQERINFITGIVRQLRVNRFCTEKATFSLAQ